MKMSNVSAIAVGLLLTCTSLAGNMNFVADAAAAGKQNEEGVAQQINPEHSGSITFSAGFAAPLTQLWSYNTGNSVTYPLVAANRVYVVSDGNDLFALDVTTGSKIWEHLLGGDENLGAYDKGKLFLEDSEGQLTALKASSGKQLWSAVAGSGFDASSPIAIGGQVFVGGETVTAVDETTGTIDWSEDVEASSSGVAYGDGVLFAGGPCQYYAFKAEKGTLVWHDDGGCDGGGGILAAYYDKREYLVDWAEGNFVLNAKTGSDAGTFSGSMPPTFFTGSDNRGYGLVYTDGKLYCFDVKTGNVAWSFTNSALVGQPIAINGQPIVGSSTGAVYMLDGATGTQLWTANVGAYVTSLNAGDGVLVVAAGDTVTAFAPQ